ncbi:MAG: glycosyltransferase family 39 protein [Planctomycetota bacterium]|nr:glycosyltransferase family 39 protein [Planctomycetota bacterium]
MSEFLTDKRLQGFPRWGGALTITLAGLVMLGLSWRKWPDVLIDYGQQLYLAWQMAEGRSLYGDLVCNYGPLAAYLNAWVFQIFGGSMMALVGCNLLVFVGIAVFLHRLLCRVGTALSAIVGGLLLMLVFGFSQLTLIGNFNFAAPYENSLTVGLMAALAALWCGLRTLDDGSVRRALWTGGWLGLAFLTKPEVFLAGAAGVAAAWIAMAWSAGWGVARLGRLVAIAALGLLVPLVVSVLALASAMPFGTAVSGTLGSWSALVGSSTSELLFYRRGMGTDDLAGNLGRMLLVAAVWAAVAGSAVIVGGIRKPGSSSAAGPGPRRAWVGVVIALLVLGLGCFVVPLPAWQAVARPLPLAMLLIAGLALRDLRRQGPEQGSAEIAVARLAMAVFAGVLLLKMILNTRVGHYGFALAMPATLVVSTAMMAWLPAWVVRRGGSGVRAAGVCGGVLAAFAVVTIYKSTELLADKTVAVGTGPDQIFAKEDWRGDVVNAALVAIEKLPGDTMAVFPEGSLLNYLTRRRNPTPFYNYMPTGFSIFGEAPILQSLQKTPPDVVVLVDKDTSEFGFQYFGTHYAQQTAAWLGQNYIIAQQLGAEPLTGQGFGILVLRRRR